MADGTSRSWRASFEGSLKQSGVHLRSAPSLDSYLEGFPLEDDQRWGPDMGELHRAALWAYVQRHVAFISNDLEVAIAECGSPPERAMLYALSLVAWEWADGVLLRVRGNASGYIATRGVYVEIQPQAQLGRDRVDFLLSMSLRVDNATLKVAKLIVECDGYEWHERSHEQAKRDRARDRRLQALDLAVFRYTGGELWDDVFAAAFNATQELARRFGDVV